MARTIRAYTLDSNETQDFGTMANPQIQATGDFGGGTITVKLDGIALLTTYTDDFEKIFDTSKEVAKIEIALSGSTDAGIDVTVVGSSALK